MSSTSVASPEAFRRLCRNAEYDLHTSGILPGFLQANLLILPEKEAKDFADLCFRNPVACPLLATTLGDPRVSSDDTLLKPGTFDIRTDFPKYNIYEKGTLVKQKTNCNDEWTSGYIGFLIGCSYSFERALCKENLTPKNVALRKNVSMFKTTKMLDPAGIFINCPYVVSMRPYKLLDVPRVRAVTRKFRKTHGEPIDWGYDGAYRLGIEDLLKPDYGDPVEIGDDEVPVFWACGVTPQLAIETVGHLIAGPVVGHAPGHMLLCDLTDEEFVNR